MEINWQRSSFCGNSACVEVARVGDEWLMRNSTDVDGPVLRFTREEWTAFESGVRNGEFTR